MGELSIKIKIGDREYPMKVEASEEAAIRQAGKELNEKIKSYRDQFGIDDKQDLLAMVAFDCMIEKMRFLDSQDKSDRIVFEKLIYLNNRIASDLTE